MVRKKHQSKRLAASKRYKIQKNVREHQRKVRKEEKLRPKSNKPKKDPGVPNLFPFKDKVLKEAEESKRKAEEEKARQKRLRQQLHSQNRSLNADQVSLLALAASAQKRSGDYEKKTVARASTEQAVKDNSKKAYYREFKKVIEAADVILEVLDARDPIGCRSKQVEEMIMNAGADKKIILVLNKIDLVPREVVEKWMKHLRNEFPAVAFKASTQSQKNHIGQSVVTAERATEGALNTSECLGADALMKLLKNYTRNANVKSAISVGVIGFPNVGKSSLINSLKRSKACNVGATPGVTKNTQEIILDKHIKLIDCPGIVFASGKSQSDVLLLRNCLKVEQIEDPVGACDLLLKRCNKNQVMNIYSVASYSTVNEFLVNLARQRGKLKKGGIADLEAVSKIVLKDWNIGKIPYYVMPPKDERMLATTVVSKFSTEFSVNDIEAEQTAMLQGIRDEAHFGSKVVPLEFAESHLDVQMDGEDQATTMDDDDDSDHDDYEDEEGDEAPELVPMEDSDHEDAEEIGADEVAEFKVTKKQKKKTQDKPLKQQVVAVANSELNYQTNKDLKKLQKKLKKKGLPAGMLALQGLQDDKEEEGSDFDFDEDFEPMQGSDDEGGEGDEGDSEGEDFEEDLEGFGEDDDEDEEDNEQN